MSKPVLSEVEGLALFGFVFSSYQHPKISISLCHYLSNANSPIKKLALFFQISNEFKPQMDADERGFMVIARPKGRGNLLHSKVFFLFTTIISQSSIINIQLVWYYTKILPKIKNIPKKSPLYGVLKLYILPDIAYCVLGKNNIKQIGFTGKNGFQIVFCNLSIANSQ